ncbi:MAG TPA: hypothetical protein VGD46_21165, partial [Rhizobacter sp.]
EETAWRETQGAKPGIIEIERVREHETRRATNPLAARARGRVDSPRPFGLADHHSSIQESAPMASRCIRITISGTRCERDAQFPTNYCWQHQPDSGQTKPAGARATPRKPAEKKKPAARRGARR